MFSFFFLVVKAFTSPNLVPCPGRTCCARRSDGLPQSEAGVLGRRWIDDCGPSSWNLAGGISWGIPGTFGECVKKKIPLETQITCKDVLMFFPKRRSRPGKLGRVRVCKSWVHVHEVETKWTNCVCFTGVIFCRYRFHPEPLGSPGSPSHHGKI